MADYQVNLELAIKNAKELQRTRVETRLLQRDITKFNLEAKKGTTAVVKNFDNLSKEVARAREAMNEAAIGTDQFNDAVKNVVKVEEEFNKEMKVRNDRLKAERFAKQKGITVDQAIIKLRQQEINAEAKLAAAKQKTANAEKRKKIGSTISSAAIGGAFPLLFGQTGAAAVGGGIGGAAGGLIGGQFGFALSIVGTAIGSLIQQQDELDKSLLKISRSFENAGSSAGFTRASFNELKSTLRMTKDEVLAIVTEFARFGEAGESAAFIFGDNPNTFKNLAAMRDTKTLMTAILDEQNGLSIKQQIQLLREAKLTSFKDMQLKLNRLILEENMRREISEARQITRQQKISDIFKEQLRIMILMKVPFFDLAKQFPEFFKKSAEKVEENVNKIKKEFEELFVQLPELQDLLTELEVQVEGMSYSIPSAIDSVSAELRKLMSVGYMVTTVADTVGSAFEESFKGIVKGSMTAQEALRNLFMRTADAFLDMAAQLIAKQIQMKILGIGLNFFMNQGLAPSRGATTGGTDRFGRDFDDPEFGMPLANGGIAKAGRTHLVGERGPELFTPGVTGTVTPNHALGGSTNIVVNVDASGSSVEGDEEQGRELGRLISVAVQSEIIQQQRPGGLLA